MTAVETTFLTAVANGLISLRNKQAAMGEWDTEKQKRSAYYYFYCDQTVCSCPTSIIAN